MHIYLLQRPKTFFFLVLFAFQLPAYHHLYAQQCPRPSILAERGATICEGQSQVLRASFATGTPPANVAYQWFKDGAAITDSTNVQLTVNAAGSYTVSVTGVAPNTCTTVTSAPLDLIVVSLPTTPAFTFAPDGQCSGTPITFTVDNPNPALVYEWAFGDDSTATGAQVTHVFDAANFPGSTSATFNVQVRAVGPAGTGCESAPASQTVTVATRPLLVVQEENDFKFCEPDTAAAISATPRIFNETDPAFNTVTEYRIKFGDNPVQVVQPANFTATVPVEGPTYTEVGSYPVTITAVGSNGCEAVFTRDYTVNQKPEAGFSSGKQKGTPIDGKECISHIFTAKDTTNAFGVTREWIISKYREQPNPGQLPEAAEFRFGSFSSDSIAIEFFEEGVYQIQMIINGGCGNDTASTVAIVGYPIVQVQPQGPECGPQTFTLQAQIDANFGTLIPATLQWTITGGSGTAPTFVNGTNANSESPQVSFQPSNQPYEIRLTVANECGSVMDIPEELRQNTAQVLVFPFPPAPTVAAVAPICDGDSATIRPSGPLSASRPGVYLWYEEATGGNPIAAEIEFTTPPLSATGSTSPTTYTFYVSTFDQNGCESQTRTPVEVVVLPPVSNNVVSGDQDVCADVQPADLTGPGVQGGTGTYAYRWQRSVAGPDTGFSNAPGVATSQDYAFTGTLNQTTWFRRIVTSGTCSSDTSNVVQITVTPAITQNTISANQAICASETPAGLTGSTPAGGEPGDLTFRWESSMQGPNAGFSPASGDNASQGYTFSGPLAETTWFRRVVLSGGCETESNVVEITVTPLISNNTIFGDQTLCPNEPAEPLAGSTPLNAGQTPGYRWESSSQGALAGFRPAAGSNEERDYAPGVLAQTTWFRRIVFSGNSCRPDTSEVVQIAVMPEIADNRISGDQTICIGTIPQSLREVIPTAGRNYTYRWEISTTGAELGFAPAPGTNNAAGYTPEPISQPTWFRRVIISQGCTSVSNAIAIEVVDTPASPAVTAGAEVCPGGRATLTASGQGDNTLEWFTQETGGNPVFVGANFQTPPLTANTTYYVQATNDNGCVSAQRTPATVTVVAPETTVSEDVEIIQGRTTELRASGGASYVWSPATGLDDPNIASPIARPDRTTTYRVTITTELGCVVTEEVTVTVIPAIDVPNAFTPNRDGVNEVWEIGNIRNYPEAVVEVFNRWGQRVFRSEGYAEPWDGRVNGSELPVATYYYIIYLNKQENPISGSVTILR